MGLRDFGLYDERPRHVACSAAALARNAQGQIDRARVKQEFANG